MNLKPMCISLFMGFAAATPSAAEPARTPLLKFESTPDDESYEFRYSPPDEPYLLEFQKAFELDQIIADAKTDFDRLLALNTWVHRQWEHDGSNEPERFDPASILEEAADGGKFRCVEYSIVITGCLNAVGIPCRILELKTRGSERSRGGAGHVLAEAYLQDLDKWVLVDPQWDVMVMEGDRPLNAVELQEAMSREDADLRMISSNPDADAWLDWVAQYLYYFDVRFDQRVLAEELEWGRPRLMLVPVGAKKPTQFQHFDLPNVTYTHSAASFYAPPELPESGS